MKKIGKVWEKKLLLGESLVEWVSINHFNTQSIRRLFGVISESESPIDRLNSASLSFIYFSYWIQWKKKNYKIHIFNKQSCDSKTHKRRRRSCERNSIETKTWKVDFSCIFTLWIQFERDKYWRRWKFWESESIQKVVKCFIERWTRQKKKRKIK